MRSRIGYGLVITSAFLATDAPAAPPAATPSDRAQDFVQTQAISARCQKILPGLKLQLQDGRERWLSTFDPAQLQVAQAYAASKEGKRLGNEVERDASRAFGRNTLSAAATCISLLGEYSPAHPLPTGSAMPAERVQHYMFHFTPMALARLQCARLDGIDVATQADGSETWQYRACGRVETVRMAPVGQSWSMTDADRNRLFEALTR
ncbi:MULTISPECIES: hypothetical protein [Stenotrophomonas]|uniref:hypothetical protein n=1 Tax=Stenotrophomonas TaxID=40323 RepID=UPI001CC4D43E|nr:MULTISPECIES: hypothetical protein [Stenotrophomonas]